MLFNLILVEMLIRGFIPYTITNIHDPINSVRKLNKLSYDQQYRSFHGRNLTQK